jgi:hypothetical protein
VLYCEPDALPLHAATPTARDSKEFTKYYLACKNGLTEEEKATLVREIELLLGKFTPAIGNEREQGWFLYDELYEWEPGAQGSDRVDQYFF